MARLSQSSQFEEGEHGLDACSFEHCVVYHLDSPRDANDASQAAHMKAVESPLLPGAQGPGFAAAQKGAHHTSLVHLYFRVLCHPGDCGSCLSDASVELGLKGEAVRDCCPGRRTLGRLRVRTRGC